MKDAESTDDVKLQPRETSYCMDLVFALYSGSSPFGLAQNRGFSSHQRAPLVIESSYGCLATLPSHRG